MIDSADIQQYRQEILPVIEKGVRQPSQQRRACCINDDGVIETAIREAGKQPKGRPAIQEGKEGVLGYFVGAVMKATRGRPTARVNEMARRLLKD